MNVLNKDKVKTLLFLVLLQVNHTKSGWQFPAFNETDPPMDGVTFQSAEGVQKISVREELMCPFKLAKINYQGRGIPTLGAFDIGDNTLLGARIVEKNDEWFVTIERRQDYENPQQRIYAFQIYIKDDDKKDVNDNGGGDDMEHGILLTLENIFDNNPSITYSPSPCRVEELKSNFLTDCIFSIYDADGMERNNIRIEVNVPNQEQQKFDFIPFGETTTFEKQFKLSIIEVLHYEERAIYNLNVKVYDSSNNTGEIYAILEVVDLPNRDPMWVRPLTTATFDEKQEQFFTLKAIDGDTGINKPICYKLEFEEDYSSLISIDKNTGLLHVAPIDRDLLNQQIFSFYTCAYKCDEETWIIKNMTILVVQDINDHIPEITLEPQNIKILEAKSLKLPLREFYIEDKDLGINATYQVYLASSSNVINYAEAFALIPSNGYQSTNFSLTVTQPELLDYENTNWRTFQVMIVAQEVDNDQHYMNSTLTVELINWNDEWPIFELDSYEISVLENITKGSFLASVHATDRDVDDKVIHSIVGQMPGWHIDANTGDISTSTDNVFDYERQSLVLLQIAAKDTLKNEHSDALHTSYAQLTINVIDVNDEMPELRLPRSIVNVTENSLPNTLVSDKIEARDADTSAELKLEILWNASYATKSGQPVANKEFVNCFVLKSQYESNNLVYGLLRVHPKLKQAVDYEKYDTIFLMIRVQDLNQEINEDSTTAVLTIRVDDVNDNAPQFRMNTLKEPRKVTELEEVGVIIGNIEAFDIDGPENNIVTYIMRPLGNLTEYGLVFINDVTGVMRVAGYIECDVPKIYHLEYEIELSDMVHTTRGKLNISIIDINNRLPELDDFEQQVAIYENATSGVIVGQVQAHDDDRDAPHNVLEYTINSGSSGLHNLFQINSTNGLLKVALRNGLELDRDNGITYHYIAIDIKDNFDYNNRGYGPVNQRTTFINVTLLDVNDNAPIMPARSLFSPEFSETALNKTFSKAQIKAEDRDEPNTANSRVSYSILSIKPAQSNAINVANYSDIFDIESNSKGVGRLVTRQNLKGFYGLWELEVKAFDHGTPPLYNISTYEVYVRPYNFHAPKILYPSSQKSIRVCYALQELERPLYQADCVSRLPLFQAFDSDGAEYGDVTFQLSSDYGHDEYFRIVKENRQQSSFYLQKLAPAGIYYLNLRVIDGGGSSSEEIHNLKIVFVDMLGNPLFLERTFETNFTENELGLLEERLIPEGYDPKNEGLEFDEEQYPLYYFIDDSVYQNDSSFFSLDSQNRTLRLLHPLDREAVDQLTLRVKVTNSIEGIITNPNSVNYTLDIIVKVNDVNDNPPVFTQRFYAAGITLKDTIDKEILTVQATDVDLNDSAMYKINISSLATYGENLDQQKTKIFTLNPQTGILSLSAYITSSMKGYFMFDIIAEDTAEPPHTDIASIKVYIVSEANRVRFVFLSNVQAIRDNEKLIRDLFARLYDYEICNIDAINDITNQQRTRRDISNAELGESASVESIAFITEVIVHFIQNNEAVDAVQIQKRAIDLAFVSKLQNSLQPHNLILNDVPHITHTEATEVFGKMLEDGVLIACGAVALATTVLIGVLVLKIRALKHRLSALEAPRFTSQVLNIVRPIAPTTNIHAAQNMSTKISSRCMNDMIPKQMIMVNENSSDISDDEFRGVELDDTFKKIEKDSFGESVSNLEQIVHSAAIVQPDSRSKSNLSTDIDDGRH